MTTFKTSREIPATVEQVFAAFSDPARLSRWWGPAGFTNTFSVCELKTGGRWVYVMHGPDGKNYLNESVFEQIEPPRDIVIEHISKPKYRLNITLTPSTKGTAVSWSQVFENAKFAKNIEKFLATANEQNLDRLTAEVAREI
ncbi:MAG: SRPBCC family protein [Candidatus Omnitrophota bacterium]|nr:SRPBCC family protein [Candidatus Omnitrophota bacterium]MDZ4243299.1 SRPBCC family protein [Candidatus Omnitrophota bacterium]